MHRILPIALAIACFACHDVRGEAPKQRPLNFLFITVDDMNWDSIGAYGNPITGITPNIDRLASQGLRFENGHVTIAICQPTRAVWMTGRYPHRSGALGFDPINPGVPTLLERLKASGYHTGILAKVPHVVPTRRKAWDTIVEANQLRQGRDPELYYSYTKAMLEEAADNGKPFFIMANSQDPHRPFAGSEQEQRFRASLPTPPRTFDPKTIPLPGFLPDLPEVRLEIAEYFASVHRADQIVGQVLRALDESGQADNTLVMFLSDHGMPLPFAKTNCYLHSTKTPWIVRLPGRVEAGAVDRKHVVAGIDLAPTVLDALGLPPLDGADGRSFLPVLLGGEQEGRGHVFTSINRTAGRNEYPMRAVTGRRFGYIFNTWSNGQAVFRNESQGGRTMHAMIAAARTNPQIAARVELFLHRAPEELYDYKNDPDALHNLAGDPAYAEVLKEHRRLLAEHLHATGDPQTKVFDAFLGHANAGATVRPLSGMDLTRFKQIFDGKTLDGWDGDPTYWSVRDGAMVGTITPETLLKKNSWIVWRGEQVEDFELILEYKVSDHGNSGVGYRLATLEDDPFSVRGPQADIHGQPMFTGITYEENGRRLLASRGQSTWIDPGGKPRLIAQVAHPGELQALVRDNDWNTYRVLAKGRDVKHFLNGKIISEYHDYDDANRMHRGLIGVQVHVGPPMTIEFRNIYLKHIGEPPEGNAGREHVTYRTGALVEPDHGETFAALEQQTARVSAPVRQKPLEGQRELEVVTRHLAVVRSDLENVPMLAPAIEPREGRPGFDLVVMFDGGTARVPGEGLRMYNRPFDRDYRVRLKWDQEKSHYTLIDLRSADSP